MKIQILSDLHFEFQRDGGKGLVKECKTDADVLVIAGDLDSQATLESSLSLFCAEYKDVVYVTGNHEYYHSSFEEVDKTVAKALVKNSNLHLLDGSYVIIDGKRFIGGTMWFPFDQTNILFEGNLNDFTEIKGFKKRVYHENHRVVKYLEDTVVYDDIVVTHHLPSMASVAEEYKKSNLNRFFVCDVERIMLKNYPKLWIHGHTHSRLDYMVDKTRVVCNPFGYAGFELNKDFSSNMIVEI